MGFNSGFKVLNKIRVYRRQNLFWPPY